MAIFTFGFGHICPQCARPLSDCYIELPSREAMVGLFGIKWAQEYRSQADAGVERFFLNRVTPGACACGRFTACIGCGVVVSGGNCCDRCDLDELEPGERT